MIKLNTAQLSLILEVADEPHAQKRGLSGRHGMPQNTGMIFVLKKPADPGVWMKDMLFAIDIIWLDDDKRVLHVKEQVSPDTYPQKYRCGQPAKYIIELNAETAATAGLRVGQIANFDYNTNA